MCKNLIIYYFTGTGNALAAARWCASVAEQHGVSGKIIKIKKHLKADISQLRDDTLVGFCYPTHGFNAPPIVLDFLWKFPKTKNKVFLINTRAGMKASKLFTPGLSGLAQVLPAIILRVKGYKIVGFGSIDLPSNWISLHPGLRAKVVDSIFERCERITTSFMGKILSGEKKFRGLYSLPIDLLISPISVLYYLIGRFTLSKTYIASYKCNSCGLCSKECPVKAINMLVNRPFWTYKCESCMHCMNSCPQHAIETPHLFTFIMWWVIFGVVPAMILFSLPFYKDMPHLIQSVLDFIVSAILLLPLFFIYRILHFLLKFKAVSILITYTSLTKLKFWRRYMAPKKYVK